MIDRLRKANLWMGRNLLPWMLLLILAGGSFQASQVSAAEAGDPTAAEVTDTQADDAEVSQESTRLEPRYQPREPKEKSWYNGSYIFGMTRSVANTTIIPAGKVPLFFLTVPLDIVFLPFAMIGGLFG